MAADHRPPLRSDRFVPRDDENHFCKPSAVAVLSTGDFFVADGYCNTRIIKYTPDGQKILQWGRHAGESPFVFKVPHALTLAEDRGLVCVADRERGRVACFQHSNGSYVSGFSSWLIGSRLFSVAYAPVNGGRLYVVNGPSPINPVPVRGYVIDFTTGKLVQTFAPDGDFSNPHDVVTSPDGSRVYVAELSPYKAHKFVDDSLRNVSEKDAPVKMNLTVHVKPTATIEITNTTVSPGTWESWRSAVGGAVGAGGAALLALAAIALLKARNKGRKSVPRRRWEYGGGEFKLRRLLEGRAGRGGRGGRFTRVHSDDSEDEPAPMLPPQPPANA
ncbi:hypothetical protein O0L34_g10014 [Tuta absoluta]|nr:hypothetical protein O0L34_g10014 [Tuta absoluta]